MQLIEKGKTLILAKPLSYTHVYEYNWEDPKLDSPIPWHELVGGVSHSSSEDESDYDPESKRDF